MKSYHILDCHEQQKIADSLYGYYIGMTANRKITKFWNPLTRKEIQDYFLIPNNPTKLWFDKLGLRVRDMSFTVYNQDVSTDVHKDDPPVIAKINFPVINTKDTYNVWFNDGETKSIGWNVTGLSCYVLIYYTQLKLVRTQSIQGYSLVFVSMPSRFSY
jgi:hypothetical protein